MTNFRRLRSQIVSFVLWVISAEKRKRTKAIPVNRGTSVLLDLIQASGPAHLGPMEAIEQTLKIKASVFLVPLASSALKAPLTRLLHLLGTISPILG
jgi:hypothetical protein